MLSCTTHDSLIRDHAVLLMAFLQTQLKALAGFCSNERMINETDQLKVLQEVKKSSSTVEPHPVENEKPHVIVIKMIVRQLNVFVRKTI
ncbi:hypothetical protein SOVF_123120 [Spinacia oleracea]|nr:hypothetical protein SOVF_123120 [Spinacia oleracea]